MLNDIPDVADLTQRIASGDTEAFAAFYEAWFDGCLADVQRRTGLDELSCLDVVQDAVLRVATRMPVFDKVEDLRRWMRRVLVNGAWDHIRARVRRSAREQRHAPRGEQARDDVDGLRDMLATLDHDAADLLRRRFDFGWTLEQIGRELGLKPGAVDGRIRRILTRLKGSP